MRDQLGFLSLARNFQDNLSEARKECVLLPSVRTILASDELQRGTPEVLAGRAALDREVRWIHIVETTEVESLLRGQELVLSTGAAWPTQPQSLQALAAALAKVGIAGLVLELSDRLPHAPGALVEAFRRHGVPLIVLHSKVQFIAVTESVHSAIVARQMAMLRTREDVNQRYTEMIARGATSTFILQQTSELLGQPVLLTDVAGRIVTLVAAGRDVAAIVHNRQHSPERWGHAEVMAHGQHWGALWAQPAAPEVPAHPAGVDYLLGQAALALAVGRLAAGVENPWRIARDQQLVSAVRSGNYATDAELFDFADAVGLPLREAGGYGVALSITAPEGQPGKDPLSAGYLAEALEAEELRVSVSQDQAAKNRRQFSILLAGDRLEELAGVLRSSWPEVRIAAGRLASTPGEFGASLHEAGNLLAMPSTGFESVGKENMLRADAHQLRLLIRSLRSQSSLPAFVAMTLGPVLAWDAKNSGDLLQVLRAYLRHPGNRTAAAAESHLSRSVFYQRLALIEEVLAADLSAGETISALYSAVLAHDSLS